MGDDQSFDSVEELLSASELTRSHLFELLCIVRLLRGHCCWEKEVVQLKKSVAESS
jgi:hypothetical protein